MRSVTIHREQPVDFYVVMAQTTTSRDRLLQRLLAFSIAPQILLLIGLALWLQRAIETDLHPLAELTRLVGKRDARDLTPVPVSGSTRDVQRLGQAVNALLTRIAQSVQAQREFSGNVAHELRTPLAGIRALAAKMPTYITIKDVKKRWGQGQEDVFPVAQFEKLWGDMTALPEVDCRFVVVPRLRGQQLKDIAQLDGWLRDGSAAYVESLCEW